MSILTYTLPRKHESLSRYSKTDLDKAEYYLNKNLLRLTPLTTWLARGFIIILYLLSEISFGKQLDQKIFYSEEIDFLVAAVIVFGSFYFGEKTCDKHFLKLALAYMENSKKTAIERQ